MISCRNMAAAIPAAAVFIIIVGATSAGRAQSLKVVPVNIQIAPGEKAATLTVINDGSTATAIQIRTYDWGQPDGKDQLTPSTDVLASPPVVTIAPGESQVIRLVLRRSPQGKEATYRILLDQIPPPAEPGIVHMVLRLSIPIFAQPTTRGIAHVRFHLERDADNVFLVGTNDGLRHEAFRDIVLSTSDGRQLKPATGVSPYVLSGVTRRWALAMQGTLPTENEVIKMTAQADGGKIEQQVRFVGVP
jgi:fimbrial chaperone protein